MTAIRERWWVGSTSGILEPSFQDGSQSRIITSFTADHGAPFEELSTYCIARGRTERILDLRFHIRSGGQHNHRRPFKCCNVPLLAYDPPAVHPLQISFSDLTKVANEGGPRKAAYYELRCDSVTSQFDLTKSPNSEVNQSNFGSMYRVQNGPSVYFS